MKLSQTYRFPVISLAVRKAIALDDYCPECGGELDTGWECNACGFDAKPLVQKQYALPTDSKGGQS